MRSLQTIIAVAVLAIIIAAGITLGPRLGHSLLLERGAETGARPTSTGTGLAARRAQIERLARDPDVTPELIELLRGLQLDLQAQGDEQLRLAGQLAELRRERLALSSVADAVASTDPPTNAFAESPEAVLLERFRGRPGPVTEDRLVAAGFAADQAREIVSRADVIAMERLNVQYQAAREGWLDTEQYREALADLPDVRKVLTTQYGDDAYDRYLYASGRPNRLIVQDVLQDSPAGAAGLQPGDRVLALADDRIYSTRDLMNIASSGREGETVPLVVERGDAIFELYVPRGPLGIRGGRGFENPANP
jgi:hypothetical protein